MADTARQALLLMAGLALVGCGPADDPSSADPPAAEVTVLSARHWVSVTIHPDVQARLGGLEPTVFSNALAASFNQSPPRAGPLNLTREESCHSVRPTGPKHCVDGFSIGIEPHGRGYVLTVDGSIGGKPVDRRVERSIDGLNVDGWSPEKAALATRALGAEGFARPDLDDTPSLSIHSWEIDYSASVLNDLAEVGQNACSEATGRLCAAPPRWPAAASPAA